MQVEKHDTQCHREAKGQGGQRVAADDGSKVPETDAAPVSEQPLRKLIDVGVLAGELAALCAEQGDVSEYPRIMETIARAVSKGVEEVIQTLDHGAPATRGAR